VGETLVEKAQTTPEEQELRVSLFNATLVVDKLFPLRNGNLIACNTF
jgi:hypothetical protein